MGVDVGPDGVFRPGGVDFAAGDIFDVVGEVHRHVLGGGVAGGPQVDGDVPGDIDGIQHLSDGDIALRADGLLLRDGAQGVGGNLKNLPRLLLPAHRLGVQLQGNHRFHPGKDLDAPDGHRGKALCQHLGVVEPVGEPLVIGVQACLLGRGTDPEGRGASGDIGDKGGPPPGAGVG